MENQDFIIRKNEDCIQVLEFIANCYDDDMDCEFCKERICMLPENKFYSGFAVSKKECCSSTIRYEEVGSAYLLSYEDAKQLFDAIENMVLLIWQYTVENFEKYEKAEVSSGYFIRFGNDNIYSSVCLDRISSEGELTDCSIEDKQYLSRYEKCNKKEAEASKKQKNLIDILRGIDSKEDLPETRTVFYKELYNSKKVEIPENVYKAIKKHIVNCLKTIYMMLEVKYNFCTLRHKYISVCESDDYMNY